MTLKEMREAAKKAYESKVSGPVEPVVTTRNEGSSHDPRQLQKPQVIKRKKQEPDNEIF